MPKRILFLDALGTIAGGQRVLLQAAAALDRHERHALLPAPGPLSSALEEQNIRCYYAPMGDYTLVQKSLADMARFPADQLRLVRECQLLIRELGINLVYANSSRTFIWGTLAASREGIPILWHLHNILGDKKTGTIVRSVGQLRAVRRILAVSPEATRQVGSLVNKTTVVRNGVDTECFRPRPDARKKIRQELGIAPGEYAIGMVGDLLPLKGQMTLLNACKQLPADPICIIIGDARPNDAVSLVYEKELRLHAGKRTLFTGKRDDIPELLSALDVLVIASEWETGPVVLLEGMATGLLVLSSPVGLSPEALPQQCLFPVNDAPTLAALLEYYRLAVPLRQQTGLRNRETAQTKYSLQRFQHEIQTSVSALLSEYA